jgi:uncharacterized membrane protein
LLPVKRKQIEVSDSMFFFAVYSDVHIVGILEHPLVAVFQSAVYVSIFPVVLPTMPSISILELLSRYFILSLDNESSFNIELHREEIECLPVEVQRWKSA